MTQVDEWSGIVLGMWADDVLKLHPKTDWKKDPTIFNSGMKCKRGKPMLIVTYHYQEADVTLEHATVKDALYGDKDGDISVYAVQKIELKESNGHNGGRGKHKSKISRAERRRRHRAANKTG